MQSMRIAGLVLLMSAIAAGAAVADHIPNVFQLIFPVGDSVVIRSDRIGAGTYESLGADWAVTDYHAEISYNTMYISTTAGPAYFILEWHGTEATMPLSVDIVSATDAEYSIVPIIQTVAGGVQDFSLATYDLTGDYYFGQHMPVADLVSFKVILENPNTTYDLTVTMDWGTGVANDTASWDQVKSLYR